MTLAPAYLKKGDTVIILSTARKISQEEIQAAKDLYESWGLKVLLGDTIGAEYNQFAGEDKLREADFQKAIDNENIKAIFCARGGYGTVRIIDNINFERFLLFPKWVIGFSDVTYLHSLINHQLGVQTLHAPMPSTIKNTNADAIENMRKVLFGEQINYELTPSHFNRAGVMNAEVVGGNLSILYSITGTRSGFDPSGKILFLEDLDEYLYHIDRMMLNLKRSGKLGHLAGLLVGGFSDMKDNQIPFGKTAEEIIAEHVAEYNYPVCFNFPAGHTRENQPIVLGRKLRVEVKSV